MRHGVMDAARRALRALVERALNQTVLDRTAHAGASRHTQCARCDGQPPVMPFSTTCAAEASA
jgi:hypothetical protein